MKKLCYYAWQNDTTSIGEKTQGDNYRAENVPKNSFDIFTVR